MFFVFNLFVFWIFLLLLSVVVIKVTMEKCAIKNKNHVRKNHVKVEESVSIVVARFSAGLKTFFQYLRFFLEIKIVVVTF